MPKRGIERNGGVEIPRRLFGMVLHVLHHAAIVIGSSTVLLAQGFLLQRQIADLDAFAPVRCRPWHAGTLMRHTVADRDHDLGLVGVAAVKRPAARHAK